jgi:hypothetical protein
MRSTGGKRSSVGGSTEPSNAPWKRNFSRLEPVQDGVEVRQVLVPIATIARVDGIHEVEAQPSTYPFRKRLHLVMLTGITSDWSLEG